MLTLDALILYTLPLAVVLFIVFSLVSARRVAHRNLKQIDESLDLNRRMAAVAEETLAVQKEQVRLLSELLTALRDRA